MFVNVVLIIEMVDTEPRKTGRVRFSYLELRIVVTDCFQFSNKETSFDTEEMSVKVELE